MTVRTSHFIVGFLGLAFSASVMAEVAKPSRPSGPLDFNRDVRPILSENCFSCHGQDPKQRKAKLRLDDAESATKKAIVPGKPDASPLVQRIFSDDPDEQMPPPDARRQITLAQKQVLKKWIAEGAKYSPHWAFIPPVRPAMPEVKRKDWVRTPIDAFVLSRLEAEGLSPAPEADKVTLLRRLSLDLIGLPPTITEVDAFLADASPNAYEKQVERLLASPHYGERWGRHWLDAARYADSDGFEKDKQRFIWFYRDWVINAMNRDLPYDQFITEQIAGDQLPNATQEQRVATGFLRNALLNEEGGVDPEQFRMDGIIDRMDSIGKSILGLTIQCAQCHSHKFDPLAQEEYYRLFAFLNNDNEAFETVYLPEQQSKVEDLWQRMRQIELELQRQSPDWQEKMSQWEAEVTKDQPNWTVMELEHSDDNSTHFYRQPDGSVLAQGYATTKATEVFKSSADMTHISAVRLELLTDPNLPAGGPGRSIKGTCAVSEFWVEAAPASAPEKKAKLRFASATSDYDQPERELEKIFDDRSGKKRTTGPVSFALDDKDDTAWGIDAGPGRRNQARKAVFVFDKPTEFDGPVRLSFHIKQNHGGWNSDDNQNNNPGRFRISITDAPGKVTADPLPSRVRKILAIPQSKRTPAQVAEVFSFWRTTVPEWKEANARIEALWAEWPEGVTTQTLIAREHPRETHVLSRGDWLKPTTVVTPGVPAFLNSLPAGAPPTRLSLARWMTDRKAPTTARVFVNRVWQEYFGTGLVATPEDFGSQGELPSHPELLDWLACEFMDPRENAGEAAQHDKASTPWSIKHIHRLVVTSSTYRQGSRVERDLLARGPRHRVEGEVIHDLALAASGLLNDKMGGRPVMPPAPAFLFVPPASYGPFPWVDDTAPEKYRRAVYTFRRRSTPFPMFQAFDVPNGESSCVRRLRTNSPLQALVSLNEPMFVECARALARKTLEEGGKTDADRLTYAFRRVLARTPAESESAVLLTLLHKSQDRYSQGWVSPNEMASGKPTASGDLPSGATPTQLAAWTVVSRALLNLDEAITKE